MNCLWSCILLLLLVTAMADDPCRGVSCNTSKCVDGVLDADGCCKTCQNGENCWLDGVIVSDDNIIQYQGPECQRQCRCPSVYVYEVDGEGTQADCSVICNGISIHEEQ